MIIAEGPDGGGKTTLIQKLKDEFPNLAVMPRGVDSDGQGLSTMEAYLSRHFRLGFGPRLYDRFYAVSGPIYGSINYMLPPNEALKDRLLHFQWEATLLAIRPLIIYCLPDLEVVRVNLESDIQSRMVIGSYLENIYYQYQARAARDFAVGVGCVYDYNNAADWDMTVARVRLAFAQREMTV